MATPSEKLAQSLEVLKELQKNDGTAIIRAGDLSRTHRERLLKHGFIQEVIKGWYISSNPNEIRGDSTTWYTSFWQFCAEYLDVRFSEEWCTSPEQSLSLHSGNWSVPKQLLIRSPNAHNNLTNLLYNTSIFDTKLALPNKNEIVQIRGIRLYSLPLALITCSESFFIKNPTDSRSALSIIRDASEILPLLLDGSYTRAAGRLAGAFRNIGRDRIANNIVKSMKAVGYDVRKSDPYIKNLPIILSNHEKSPYVQRIKLMWQQMRESVLENFPKAPGLPGDTVSYLKQVENIYITDAYHSLSIEGYRVTPELIERVRSGKWNIDTNEEDKKNRNAMEARGYWQASIVVRKSIEKILNNQNPGNVVERDHSEWYRELFAPSITTGLLKTSDLAGYRNGQVYIRQSKHVPPNRDAVRDAMPMLFELLKDEPEPAVRVVLGHFIFVYIHPYMDGNGRMGRFLMNALLASGGYPWTVIPLEERNKYMSALEVASVEQNIKVFTKYIARLVNEGMKGKPLAKI